MSIRLVALVRREPIAGIAQHMQRRFWARFNVPQTRHLTLVVDNRGKR